MPVISRSSFSPPRFLRNAHVQTVVPNMVRAVKGVSYTRVRIATPDDDFLDLDFSPVGSPRTAIVVHGLEGNSRRPYVLGMIRALNARGWNGVGMNLRGCSGEPNRKLRFYHSGDTGDLQTVLDYVWGGNSGGKTALIGFSLGGNIVLKYLGERGSSAANLICAAAAFSVPCHLSSSSTRMALPSNRFYTARFLRSLRDKITQKMERFPGKIDDEGYEAIRTFHEFDDRYAAPIHGFKDAEDYYARASSKPVLRRIRVPTLLVNALDDPFLAPPCYPYEEARDNPYLFLETPSSGGHVGFWSSGIHGSTWAERRAVEFLEPWGRQTS